MPGDPRERWLWLAFTVLFAVVVVASVAPVEPIVGVVPFWSLLVLLACIVTLVVGVFAVRTGWPREVNES